MNDRDRVEGDESYGAALFNLIGALAYRLTGEVPAVRIRLPDGSYTLSYPELWRVTWSSGPALGVGLPCAEAPE